jgi:hypothetical protein
MDLVPAFGVLVQGLSATMTAPTFANLTVVLTGWVAGRKTIRERAQIHERRA